MTEEERSMWQRMIDLQQTHIERLQNLMYWCIALFVLITIALTSIAINLSIQHRLEVTAFGMLVDMV